MKFAIRMLKRVAITVIFRAVYRGVVYRGGGGVDTESRRPEPSDASRERGGGGGVEYERGLNSLKKIYVSENAFQAILKPSFPFAI